MKENTPQQLEAPKTREEILKMSLEAREQEVMMYQLNIDNYTLALQHISSLPFSEQEELKEFRSQLTGLLAGEILEQKKARVMLHVIKTQIVEN